MCYGINRDKFAILIWTITIIFHANSFNTRASVNLFQNMFLKSGFHLSQHRIVSIGTPLEALATSFYSSADVLKSECFNMPHSPSILCSNISRRFILSCVLPPRKVLAKPLTYNIYLISYLRLVEQGLVRSVLQLLCHRKIVNALLLLRCCCRTPH